MCFNFSNWKLKIMGYFPFPCGAFMSWINIMKCSSQQNKSRAFYCFYHKRSPVGWGRRTEEIAWHYATILHQSASPAAAAEPDAASAQPKPGERWKQALAKNGVQFLVCLNYKGKKRVHWSSELSPWRGHPLLMHSWGWQCAWPYSPKVNWKDFRLTSVRTVSVWNAELRHSWWGPSGGTHSGATPWPCRGGSPSSPQSETLGLLACKRCLAGGPGKTSPENHPSQQFYIMSHSGGNFCICAFREKPCYFRLRAFAIW